MNQTSALPRLSFNDAEFEQFQQDGYVIVRGLADAGRIAAMRKSALTALENAQGPLEYEVDVHYPGAPEAIDAPGGHTVRRLLQAYRRGEIWRAWAEDPVITTRIRQLLARHVVLPQAHHNCIMTKAPHYSSDTLWHQDIRYWCYERSDLVNVWLALGPEHADNGCLRLLPGTHAMDFGADQLDDAKFLRLDAPQHAPLFQREIKAELEPGDVLFFHARTFHAAERNRTEETKLSLVFTYRTADNAPCPGSRSAACPDIDLG